MKFLVSFSLISLQLMMTINFVVSEKYETKHETIYCKFTSYDLDEEKTDDSDDDGVTTPPTTEITSDSSTIQPEIFSNSNLKYICSIEKNDPNLPLDGTPFVSAVNHEKNKDIEDIDGFNMMEISISKFPSGDLLYFKNLITLSITKCDLPSIFSTDLQPFEKLKYLQLSMNKIEVIPPELLAYNPNLEFIDLDENLIFHIDPRVFEEARNLVKIKISGNRCNFGNGGFSEISTKVNSSHCTLTNFTQIYNLGYFQLIQLHRDNLVQLSTEIENLQFKLDEKENCEVPDCPDVSKNQEITIKTINGMLKEEEKKRLNCVNKLILSNATIFNTGKTIEKKNKEILALKKNFTELLQQLKNTTATTTTFCDFSKLEREIEAKTAKISKLEVDRVIHIVLIVLLSIGCGVLGIFYYRMVKENGSYELEGRRVEYSVASEPLNLRVEEKEE